MEGCVRVPVRYPCVCLCLCLCVCVSAVSCCRYARDSSLRVGGVVSIGSGWAGLRSCGACPRGGAHVCVCARARGGARRGAGWAASGASTSTRRPASTTAAAAGRAGRARPRRKGAGPVEPLRRRGGGGGGVEPMQARGRPAPGRRPPAAASFPANKRGGTRPARPRSALKGSARVGPPLTPRAPGPVGEGVGEGPAAGGRSGVWETTSLREEGGGARRREEPPRQG